MLVGIAELGWLVVLLVAPRYDVLSCGPGLSIIAWMGSWIMDQIEMLRRASFDGYVVILESFGWVCWDRWRWRLYGEMEM